MAWLNIQIATFGTQHNIWRSFRSTADRPPPQSSNCCGRVGIHRVQTRFRPYTYIMMPSINSANIITIFDVYYPVSYFLTIIREEVCELWEEREVNATIILILIYGLHTGRRWQWQEMAYVSLLVLLLLLLLLLLLGSSFPSHFGHSSPHHHHRLAAATWCVKWRTTSASIVAWK